MIQVEINQSSLASVKMLLSGIKGGAETAVIRSINKGVASAQTEASKEIRKELNTTAAAVKKTFRLKKAYAGSLSGRLTSRSKPLSFYDRDKNKLRFSGRKLAMGYGFTIKKGRGRKKFRGAFYAKMKGSNYQAIWIRTGNRTSSGKEEIKPLYTSRISDILSNENRMQPVQRKAGERMKNELDRQIKLLLK